MVWLWVLLPFAIGAVGCFIYGWLELVDNFVVPVVIIVLAIASLFPVIRQIEHNLSNAACYEYGRNTGREVRYFDNSYFDYGCYVRTDSGWVARDKVNEFELRGAG